MPRILVVDDDPDIRKIAERLLVSAHYEVYLADSALAAMEMLNAAPFDAMISDANMPHYSGFDLIQTVRNNRRFNTMAVCMLTGLRERKDIERAIKAGVDDYIVKPLDPLLFLKKVEGLFQKRPPVVRMEYQFPAEPQRPEATIETKLVITSISELGLTVESPLKLREGATIDLDTNLFLKIGVRGPSMRVLAVREIRPERWELRLGFVGATETIVQKIRAWIAAEASKRAS